MNELHIREAGLDDIDTVLGLIESSGIDAPGTNDRAAAHANWPAMQAAGARLLLAERDGAALGTLTLFVLPLLGHHCAPEAVVEDVAVTADAQGMGIGRALLHHSMALARNAGCYKLALSSNLKRVDAHAFYDHLGFERHGISFIVPLKEQAE